MSNTDPIVKSSRLDPVPSFSATIVAVALTVSVQITNYFFTTSIPVVSAHAYTFLFGDNTFILFGDNTEVEYAAN